MGASSEPGARAATTCSAVAFNSWQPGADGTVVRAIMALHRASPSRALRRFLCAVGERPPLALHGSIPRVQAVDRCWCMRSGAGDACTDSGPLWVRVWSLFILCTSVRRQHVLFNRCTVTHVASRAATTCSALAFNSSGGRAGGRVCRREGAPVATYRRQNPVRGRPDKITKGLGACFQNRQMSVHPRPCPADCAALLARRRCTLLTLIRRRVWHAAGFQPSRHSAGGVFWQPRSEHRRAH